MTRKKGCGTLIRRGDKWNLVLSGGDGKRQWHSLGKCIDKIEADLKSDEFLKELRKGELLEQAKAKAIGLTLKNVWMAFKGKADCGLVTLAGYDTKWRNFLSFIKLLHPDIESTAQLNQSIGHRYVEWLSLKAIGPDTVKRHLRWVGFILRTVTGEDPFKSVPSPKVTEKAVRKGFSPADLDAMRKVFEDGQIECLYKSEMEAAHYIALNTGLRLEDTCLLLWDSVDWGKMFIKAVPEKTKRYGTEVTIPITLELECVLRKAEGWKHDAFVLPSLAKRYKGNPCGVSQDYCWLLRKAGIVTTQKRNGRIGQTLKSFHSLRHTFVSRLAERGISPLVIQSMSGHSTMLMTERYSHIGIEAKRKALGEESSVKKETAPTNESIAKKKLDAIKTLLGSKKNRTPLEEALLDLLE
jgi:integrase